MLLPCIGSRGDGYAAAVWGGLLAIVWWCPVTAMVCCVSPKAACVTLAHRCPEFLPGTFPVRSSARFGNAWSLLKEASHHCRRIVAGSAGGSVCCNSGALHRKYSAIPELFAGFCGVDPLMVSRLESWLGRAHLPGMYKIHGGAERRFSRVPLRIGKCIQFDKNAVQLWMNLP